MPKISVVKYVIAGVSTVLEQQIAKHVESITKSIDEFKGNISNQIEVLASELWESNRNRKTQKPVTSENPENSENIDGESNFIVDDQFPRLPFKSIEVLREFDEKLELNTDYFEQAKTYYTNQLNYNKYSNKMNTRRMHLKDLMFTE